MAADKGFCRLAARSLLKRLKALTKEAEGVRRAGARGDVEYVHRMRVASRRLRSALPLFEECLPKKRCKAWRKGMKAITRALGEARDLDVQIAFLEDYLAGVEPARLRRGADRLILRLRQGRERAQGAMLEALDAFEASGIADEMEQELDSLDQGGKGDAPVFRTSGAYRHASREIAVRMGEVLAFETCVDHPEKKEDLHAMRIANKRLRYVMEVFGPLYDDGLEGELDVIRAFHTQLGDIHDCDVWEEFLSSFLEEERRRTVEFFGHDRFFSRLVPGIEALSENRRSFRSGRYEAFRELFHRTRGEGFWEKLAARVKELPASSGGSGEAFPEEGDLSEGQEPQS